MRTIEKRNRITAAEDGKKGKGRIAVGVDVGSTTTQVVVFSDDILSYSNIPTGGNSQETAWTGLRAALAGTALTLEDVGYVVSTGYGRNMVPFSNRNISEVSCHARGANWLFPEVRTIVDAGGEDFKVMHCNEQGRVVYFSVSDKCAAGCGRYLEIMADLLAVPREDFGNLAEQITAEPPLLSSSCVLFAKSEALALLREGTGRNELIAAFCHSVATILSNQVRKIGVKKEVMFTGGLAKNHGVAKSLERLLDTEVAVCFEPQIVGALGAAVFGQQILEKQASGR